MYLLVARPGAGQGLQAPCGILAVGQMGPGLTDQLTERQRYP